MATNKTDNMIADSPDQHIGKIKKFLASSHSANPKVNIMDIVSKLKERKGKHGK